MLFLKKFLAYLLKCIMYLLGIQEETNQKVTATYYKKTQLLSNAEHSFYLILKQLLAGSNEIYPMVRLIDFIGAQYKDRPKLLQKHIDFLICKNNMPLLGIELDDSSHKNRAAKDAEKDHIFRTAKLPLVRIKCQRTYNTSEIAKAIKEAMINASGGLGQATPSP